MLYYDERLCISVYRNFHFVVTLTTYKPSPGILYDIFLAKPFFAPYNHSLIYEYFLQSFPKRLRKILTIKSLLAECLRSQRRACIH